MNNITDSFFKEVKRGGYDKIDVMDKVNGLVNENNNLLKQIRDLRDENESLRNEIENKYKKYADNYEEIASLVFEAKIRAKQILEEAEKEKAAIVASAANESSKILAEANVKAELIVADGRKQYEEYEAKTNNLIDKVSLMEQELKGAFTSVNLVAGGIEEAAVKPEPVKALEPEKAEETVKEEPIIVEEPATVEEIEESFDEDDENEDFDLADTSTISIPMEKIEEVEDEVSLEITVL